MHETTYFGIVQYELRRHFFGIFFPCNRSMDSTDTFDVILMTQKSILPTTTTSKWTNFENKLCFMLWQTDFVSFSQKQRYWSALGYHKTINESRHDWGCCHFLRHISEFETLYIFFSRYLHFTHNINLSSYQIVCVHFQNNSEKNNNVSVPQRKI